MLPLFTRLLSAEMDAFTIDQKGFVQRGYRHQGPSNGPQLLQKPPTTFIDHTAASILLSLWTVTASGCDHALLCVLQAQFSAYTIVGLHYIFAK